MCECVCEKHEGPCRQCQSSLAEDELVRRFVQAFDEYIGIDNAREYLDCDCDICSSTRRMLEARERLDAVIDND